LAESRPGRADHVRLTRELEDIEIQLAKVRRGLLHLTKENQCPTGARHYSSTRPYIYIR
jgi:hypothetical protein